MTEEKFCRSCKNCKTGLESYDIVINWRKGGITHIPGVIAEILRGSQCLSENARKHRDPVTGSYPACYEMLSREECCGPDHKWYKEGTR